MLPNDFVVFWEHDNHPSRYVNKFDGSYDLMTKYTGTWELYINIPENLAAWAFHEAESVYALVDRSQPKVEELPPIPSGVYWHAISGNFYDSKFITGMGSEFYLEWHHRRAEFPQSSGFISKGEVSYDSQD